MAIRIRIGKILAAADTLSKASGQITSTAMLPTAIVLLGGALGAVGVTLYRSGTSPVGALLALAALAAVAECGRHDRLKLAEDRADLARREAAINARETELRGMIDLAGQVSEARGSLERYRRNKSSRSLPRIHVSPVKVTDVLGEDGEDTLP